MRPIMSISNGVGETVWMRSVSGSTISAVLHRPHETRQRSWAVRNVAARFSEYATSAAVKAIHHGSVTPGRSLISHVSGSSSFQDVASDGWMRSFASNGSCFRTCSPPSPRRCRDRNTADRATMLGRPSNPKIGRERKGRGRRQDRTGEAGSQQSVSFAQHCLFSYRLGLCGDFACRAGDVSILALLIIFGYDLGHGRFRFTGKGRSRGCGRMRNAPSREMRNCCSATMKFVRRRQRRSRMPARRRSGAARHGRTVSGSSRHKSANPNPRRRRPR